MIGTRWTAFVTGPLQAISAVEACHHFAARGPVYYYAPERPLPALGELFSRARMDLRWVQRTRGEQLRWSSDFVPRVLAGGRVMVGSLHQRPFLLAAVLARRGVVLLDDGSRTESIAARRAAGTRSTSFLRRRLDRREMVFFSIYGPKVGPHDRLIRHRLSFVRSVYPGPTSMAAESWIIGAPFLDAGLLSADSYASLIRRFVERIGDDGKRIRYICHPRERDASAGLVCSQLGLRPERLTAPVELEVLRHRSMPEAVFSIGSTVLDTLPLLAEDFPHPPELWTARVNPGDLGSTIPELREHLASVADRTDLRIA